MELKINTSDVWRSLYPFFISSSITPAMVLELIGSVIKIIDGNTDGEVLNRIDKNVQRLIKLHMKAGVDHLKNALSADGLEDQKRWLNEAINEFIRAKAVETPPENIKATIYVATCFNALGKDRQAQEWYQEGYNLARERHAELILNINKIAKYAKVLDWGEYLLMVTMIYPLMHKVIVEEKFAKLLYQYLTELFEIEKQILLLQRIIASTGVERSTLTFYFPIDVVEVQKWSVLLNRSNTGTPVLFAFNEQGEIRRAIHLTSGQPIPENEVTGSFRRNGKHLMATWRQD